MTDVIGGTFIGVGVALTLLAGVGVLRFPDVLSRANAATKAAGLGIACIFVGVAVVFGTVEAYVKLGIATLLQFATAPVAGHVMGRAAYRSGVPLWEGNLVDELAERSEPAADERTHG